MELVESWARINTLHTTYYEMAELAYAEYLTVTNDRIQLQYSPKLSTSEGEFCDLNEFEKHHQLEVKLDHLGIQTIVFSCMCLEASIYDFAAIHLGDKFVMEHLDKMKLQSKWITIPKFISNKQISKSKPAYAALKQLIKDRNDLVHHKSRPYDNPERTQEYFNKYNSNRENAVHNSYKAMILLSLELNDLLGHHSPLFLLHPEKVKTKQLVPIIGKLKSLYKKAYSSGK